MRRVSCAIVLVILAASTARAQDSYRLAIDPGTEVRLQPRVSPALSVRGVVDRMDADTLVLRPGGSTRLDRYRLEELSRLEIRGGENKQRGFLIGAGVATGITGVFGGIDAAKGNISGGDLLGTLIGNALIGGLVGYAFAPKGWVALPLPPGR
jgi:hypothetical protein